VAGWVPSHGLFDLVELVESNDEDLEDDVGFLALQGSGPRGEHDDAAAHPLDALGGPEVDVHPGR
jgi:hypothetical protein